MRSFGGLGKKRPCVPVPVRPSMGTGRSSVAHREVDCTNIIFGSYARSEAHEESDIDVLLDGGSDFKVLNVFALAEELHERSGKSVDVYELLELDPGAFRQAVLREAIAL